MISLTVPTTFRTLLILFTSLITRFESVRWTVYKLCLRTPTSNDCLYSALFAGPYCREMTKGSKVIVGTFEKNAKKHCNELLSDYGRPYMTSNFF